MFERKLPRIGERSAASGEKPAPEALHPLLALQQAAGNAAVASLLGGAPGRPLPAPLREEAEARFGHDFGGVRIHTDQRAAEAAGGIGARAFAVGSEVVFGAGRFAPESAAGKRLIGHELAHVVQQSRGGAAPPLARGGPLERAAHGAGEAFAGGQGRVQVGGASGVGVAADLGTPVPDLVARATAAARAAIEAAPAAVAPLTGPSVMPLDPAGADPDLKAHVPAEATGPSVAAEPKQPLATPPVVEQENPRPRIALLTSALNFVRDCYLALRAGHAEDAQAIAKHALEILDLVGMDEVRDIAFLQRELPRLKRFFSREANPERFLWGTLAPQKKDPSDDAMAFRRLDSPNLLEFTPEEASLRWKGLDAVDILWKRQAEQRMAGLHNSASVVGVALGAAAKLLGFSDEDVLWAMQFGGAVGNLVEDGLPGDAKRRPNKRPPKEPKQPSGPRSASGAPVQGSSPVAIGRGPTVASMPIRTKHSDVVTVGVPLSQVEQFADRMVTGAKKRFTTWLSDLFEPSLATVGGPGYAFQAQGKKPNDPGTSSTGKPSRPKVGATSVQAHMGLVAPTPPGETPKHSTDKPVATHTEQTPAAGATPAAKSTSASPGPSTGAPTGKPEHSTTELPGMPVVPVDLLRPGIFAAITSDYSEPGARFMQDELMWRPHESLAQYRERLGSVMPGLYNLIGQEKTGASSSFLDIVEVFRDMRAKAYDAAKQIEKWTDDLRRLKGSRTKLENDVEVLDAKIRKIRENGYTAAGLQRTADSKGAVKVGVNKAVSTLQKEIGQKRAEIDRLDLGKKIAAFEKVIQLGERSPQSDVEHAADQGERRGREAVYLFAAANMPGVKWQLETGFVSPFGTGYTRRGIDDILRPVDGSVARFVADHKGGTANASNLSKDTYGKFVRQDTPEWVGTKIYELLTISPDDPGFGMRTHGLELYVAAQEGKLGLVHFSTPLSPHGVPRSTVAREIPLDNKKVLDAVMQGFARDGKVPRL